MEDFENAVRAQVRAMVSAGEAMTITDNMIKKQWGAGGLFKVMQIVVEEMSQPKKKK